MKNILLHVTMVQILLGVDLASKQMITQQSDENQSISVVGDVVKFTLVCNEGTTFGMLREHDLTIVVPIIKIFLVFILLIVFIKIHTIFNSPTFQAISRYAILFLIAGSLAHAIGRIAFKRVTGFFNIRIRHYRWHIFNAAAIYQFIGGMTFFVLPVMPYCRNRLTPVSD